MSPIWADAEGWLVGVGPHQEIDPGSGAERYARALDALHRGGRDLAFASFTFDPEEPGSVVVMPDRVERAPVADDGRPAGLRLVDDGVAVWREGFERAMRAIREGVVSKVVLARQVVVGLDGGLDPAATVARLAYANPGCYAFAIAGLVGATPELLVALRNGRLSTLALAGTATDPGALDTVKISEEHRHVADSVIEALQPHLDTVELTEQVIVAHGAMSHVGTRVEGRARHGTTVVDLLGGLHPTAAVAGAPRRAALDLIRELEPVSRGRYAGPIGWFDTRGDGVFALALRCGQLEGPAITLFAGGGLVAGSEEEAELAETELKLAPMLAALGQLSS